MTYIVDFRQQLTQRDFGKILQLWQEYCESDAADAEEIEAILKTLKLSEFAIPFGQYVEAIVPLVLTIEDIEGKTKCLAEVLDIQTTNSTGLAAVAMDFLKNSFSTDPLFNDKLRLVGLRGGDTFKGAISNFLLLNHMKKGNFVLHTAGWGVGEISDFSLLREQLSCSFEHLNGAKKDISFKNAFKSLIPLKNEHFLAKRFADPDNLEKEFKEQPVEAIRAMLRQMGPLTAVEIKEALLDLVIPETDYAKWWQQTRAKLKKDAGIETPENSKEPFTLRNSDVTPLDRLEKALAGKHDVQECITSLYTLCRDIPDVLRVEEVKQRVLAKLHQLKDRPGVTHSEALQILLFLDNLESTPATREELKKEANFQHQFAPLLHAIGIAAFKKRLLTTVRELKQDWKSVFQSLLFTVDNNLLRDYIFRELLDAGERDILINALTTLAHHPTTSPESTVWYFQKLLEETNIPLAGHQGKMLFIEALLTLYAALDSRQEMRDLSKKIGQILINKRFAVVRDILKGTSIEFAKEFLLLASKCRGFSDHDQKVLRALVEVVHPSLAKEQKHPACDHSILWTTPESYQRAHDRIKQIATVEMVELAREIETARAHGDLRENAEYKIALEKRSRLQNELKHLSEQFHNARLITPDEITTEFVGVGTHVEVVTPKGENVSYSILGPWDADPEQSILSSQSKFAQAMLGKRKGESFGFKGEEYTVISIDALPLK